MNAPAVITGREKCLTCERYASPNHLLGGLCPVCLIRRADAFTHKFLQDVKNRHTCFECSASLEQGGYLHWDQTADTFYMLCIPCGEKAIAKAAQYRRTEFYHKHHALIS